MARIRTIKPEFWHDEKLSPLPVIDRLVFLGLISMADDAGRVLDNVRVIDAFIFPETDDTVRDSLANLSRIGRVRRGTTASGQRVIQIVNWERHQKVDKPQLKAALPEIVAPQEVGDVRESFANHSRMDREPLAPHTYDLRPTTSTNDHPAGSPAHAGNPPGSAQLALVPPDDRPAKRKRAPKAADGPAWPDWSDAARRAAYDHWRANFGGIAFGRFVREAGPTLGPGLPNYDRAAVEHAWRQCVEIGSVASPASRFLAHPGAIGKQLTEACRIIATTPDVLEQCRRLQVLLHGREVA